MEKGIQSRTVSVAKKIVLTGPESTSKTTLANQLADYFETTWTPEYAREYVLKLNRKYTFSDVEHIAYTQHIIENDAIVKAKSFLFIDTDLIISKVWMEEVFGKLPLWINQSIKQLKSDLYLLCNTDVEWQPDNLRENGGEARQRLFNRYKNELEYYNLPYKIISGLGNQRLENAINIINNFFKPDIRD